MKILVIEDKEMHQNSARETLVGHDLTIVDSFEKAVEIFEATLHKLIHWRKMSEMDAAEYLCKHKYEAVLTDMNLPMNRMELHEDSFNPSEQIPYGFVLALLAAKHGAKYIAMVTDTNHHKGAMSSALDSVGPSCYGSGTRPTVFRINEATVVFVHTPFVADPIPNVDCDLCKEKGLCHNCSGTLKSHDYNEPCWCTREDQAHRKGKCGRCYGTLKYTDFIHERKDWGRVLKDLIENTTK